MPRKKGLIKSNATGFTRMFKPSCKKRTGGTRQMCRVWIATKNIGDPKYAGYKKDPDQTPQGTKAGRRSAAGIEE